ncbi:MAG: regulatory signaling modulator protein AmpE [Hahellaceae bacterium]|nr:regulatory signaling modulator protein AmpE [Hahellaceae bacterium]
MRLLILIVAWTLHRGFHLSLSSRLDQLIERGFRAIPGSLLARSLGIPAVTVLAVSLVVAGLALLQMRLGSLYAGAPGAALEFIVLTLVIGCDRLRLAMDAYEQDERQKRWPSSRPLLVQAGYAVRKTWISAEVRQLDLVGQSLALSFQRYFLIIFWFMLGGAAGALLARLALLVSRQPNAAQLNVGQLVLPLMEWLPLRLFALTAVIWGHGALVSRMTEDRVPLLLAARDELFQGLVRSLAAKARQAGGGSLAQTLMLKSRTLLTLCLFVWVAVLAVGYGLKALL